MDRRLHYVTLDITDAHECLNTRHSVFGEAVSALEGDPAELAKRVLDHATGEIAFTQWFGAKLRFPYADVPIVSAYVAEPPTSELTEAIGVREVSSGGKLWLISPKDAGVFHATRRIEHFPVVCDVQLYLDLLQVGLRGPDQAEALRSWEGFLTEQAGG